jgi:hypothetical protein
MQQHWTYGAVHHALGGTTFRAIIKEDGHDIAICQFLCRRTGCVHVALATHGPVWLTNLTKRRKKAAIRRMIKMSPLPKLKLLFFTPVEPLSSPRNIPFITPVHNARLSLGEPGEMRLNLHQKWRNCLNQATKKQLSITHTACTTSRLATLLRADEIKQMQKGYRALPAQFSRKWLEISPKSMRLFTVFHSGTAIAQALFLRHGNTATYHIAQSSDMGRKRNAARFALWQAMLDFSRAGVVECDLGVLDTVNAAGLARFKLGTGAIARKSGGTVLAL